MKKAIISVFSVAVIVALICISAIPTYPEGRIFNYFEHGGIGEIIVNLDDYVAVRGTDSITVFEKKSGKAYPAAETAFNTKISFPTLLDSTGNTLYYICGDAITGTMVCETIDLDTYRRERIFTNKGIVSAAGFLGMEELFGLSLAANDAYMLAMKSGEKYLTDEGIQTISDRVSYLMEQDREDNFGLYDTLKKLAETDDYIFFINYFGETVRFHKSEKEFLTLSKRAAENFFITADKVYFTSREAECTLYSCDYSGENETKNGEIDPDTVKFAGNNLLLSAAGKVYRITNTEIKQIATVNTAYWTADTTSVYTYSPPTPTLHSHPY